MSVFRIVPKCFPLLKTALQNRLLQKTVFMPSVALAFACLASLPGTAIANNAPTTTANGASINVNIDSSLVFSTSMFGFADVDSGDSLQSIAITSVPQGGDFFLDIDTDGIYNPQIDFAISPGDIIGLSALAFLRYTPIAGAYGSPYAQMSFSVSDGQLSSSVATLYFNVITPQPTIAPVPLGSAAWSALLAATMLLFGLRKMRR